MINIGLSSYSMSRAINDDRMSVFEVMDYIAKNGGQHMEVVPFGKLIVNGNDELISQMVQHAKDAGIALSSYTIGANFALDSKAEIDAEVERVKGEIEVAAKLGVTRMRHDAGWKPASEANYATFEKYLPGVVDSFGILADYAKQYGIVTSLENHGYLFQGSERVQRVILGVNRDNFRTTLDVGNFLCADEDPVIATMNNIPYASMIHFKDFYIREDQPAVTDGYFQYMHGRWLKGATTGEGDVDLKRITQIIKDANYDGFLSIEFEGWEDCIVACERSLRNVIALFNN